jgi:hypothetical protein
MSLWGRRGNYGVVFFIIGKFQSKLQGAPEQVIHCIRPKIELLLLLSQNSFVGLETTYYKDKLQKIFW